MADKKQHPFIKLSNLIKDYEENKDSFDIEKLQSMREDISITLFNLSDSASEAISRYDLSEHNRKMKMAEREQFYRNDVGSDGKHMTVAESANLARLDAKEEVEACKESLRQKKRVEIILSSTTHILHAISSRLQMVK